jgi:hypothetical protein
MEGSTTVTLDSTRRTRRVAVAASIALALGAAGCGQPLDPDVQSAAPQSEQDVTDEVTSEEGDPTTMPEPDAPATEEPDAPATEEPNAPATEQPESDAPATEEPEPDASSTEQPEPDATATEEPDATATEEPDATATEEATVLEAGDEGDAVRSLQHRLEELGYWIGPTDGSFGELTEQAVLAFQGWEGLSRDGRVGPDTREAMTTASRPVPDADGDLIEVHLDRQVLLVVEDDRTRTALHVSTGTGQRYTQPSGHEAVADTPVGTWEIAWRVDGWRQSDLGHLWRPAYFHRRGIAIHGYPEVPARPASHGCVRVSVDAMDMLWDRGHVAEGTRVIVS